ncbi:5'-AMP-activated protein kinase catalytic subunit alpha-1 [Capsaspora owczarzaki ATCC 30864]|uniref:non-specific serine/threonine protein kinase n=1 Tax=Capsaspora owczarzaki (strain ATCC 30864) TaxID=595528 RepID=A0A0D2WL15_CAPO3|nr:5'-AMP-activated protein kinase catalytic subunit alpha-1 [Capsaspora owczarzaki ATCC 30864]KJE91120.1 CAMK/CAMKL protein kinase [Capsaspora owczarzaki ATCC 30864]|eukprot:XP_004349054.1 5'-AMP-activated protein kinase catalytic subunit alpha-1 [Capsaspora owczarzaki ATCC 30864]
MAATKVDDLRMTQTYTPGGSSSSSGNGAAGTTRQGQTAAMTHLQSQQDFNVNGEHTACGPSSSSYTNSASPRSSFSSASSDSSPATRRAGPLEDRASKSQQRANASSSSSAPTGNKPLSTVASSGDRNECDDSSDDSASSESEDDDEECEDEEDGRVQATPRTIEDVESFYRLDKQLGQGAHGYVRLGYHLLTNEEVALKFIPRKEFDMHAFEVRALRMLHHQHIVRLYDVIETSKHVVLVLEYMPGGELFDHIVARQRLSEHEARKIARQLASALHYCHKQGILENCLMDLEGKVKIADFGFANAFAPGQLMSTFVGSLAYTSPEIIKNEHYVGPAADVWSYGVLLFTLVMGRLPFASETLNQGEMISRILAGSFLLPEIQLSGEFCNLIRSILRVVPSERPTIEQILSHPWILGPSQTPVEHCQGESREIDETVIAELARMGRPVGDLRAHLETQSVNHATADYLLLNRRMIAQRQEAEMNAMIEQVALQLAERYAKPPAPNSGRPPAAANRHRRFSVDTTTLKTRQSHSNAEYDLAHKLEPDRTPRTRTRSSGAPAYLDVNRRKEETIPKPSANRRLSIGLASAFGFGSSKNKPYATHSPRSGSPAPTPGYDTNDDSSAPSSANTTGTGRRFFRDSGFGSDINMSSSSLNSNGEPASPCATSPTTGQRLAAWMRKRFRRSSTAEDVSASKSNPTSPKLSNRSSRLSVCDTDAHHHHHHHQQPNETVMLQPVPKPEDVQAVIDFWSIAEAEETILSMPVPANDTLALPADPADEATPLAQSPAAPASSTAFRATDQQLHQSPPKPAKVAQLQLDDATTSSSTIGAHTESADMCTSSADATPQGSATTLPSPRLSLRSGKARPLSEEPMRFGEHPSSAYRISGGAASTGAPAVSEPKSWMTAALTPRSDSALSPDSQLYEPKRASFTRFIQRFRNSSDSTADPLTALNAQNDRRSKAFHMQEVEVSLSNSARKAHARKFGVATTTTLSPSKLLDRVTASLVHNKVRFTILGLIVSCSAQDLSWEIEVCKLPHLDGFSGIVFRRTAGELWRYKQMTDRLTKDMNLV